MKKINRFIDHTLLKANAKKHEITLLINEAIEYDFYAICVNSYWVSYSKRKLKNTSVKIAAVVGFPLGAMTTKSKIYEAEQAVLNGADEIDMVINYSMIADGMKDELFHEIKQIKLAIGSKLLKVILETCNLTDEQIVDVSNIAINAGADFIKTSTGFGSKGASVNHVKLMKETINDKGQIKASGGIRDLKTAIEYLDLGVTRLGTSSGVAILKGEESDKSY